MVIFKNSYFWTVDRERETKQNTVVVRLLIRKYVVLFNPFHSSAPIELRIVSINNKKKNFGYFLP